MNKKANKIIDEISNLDKLTFGQAMCELGRQEREKEILEIIEKLLPKGKVVKIDLLRELKKQIKEQNTK